jgi:ubiquinone/menaquinone biosynthesis C-methylase UbiE
MTEPHDEPAGPVAALFDQLAPTYDQGGVDFFQPIARGLLEQLKPVAGERALDLGCGRGALTLALAAGVGERGSVVALDLSAGMLAGLAAEVGRAGLSNIEMVQGDASSPPWTAEFDLVAASLVLFFLPDPAAAFVAWLGCVKPGGRIGISTFAEPSDAERAIDELFTPYLPPGVLDARTSGMTGVFATDATLEDLFTRSGATSVSTSRDAVVTRFADIQQWQDWTMTTGRRRFWTYVPADRRVALLTAAEEILAVNDEPGDVLACTHHLRYTLGYRPG